MLCYSEGSAGDIHFFSRLKKAERRNNIAHGTAVVCPTSDGVGLRLEPCGSVAGSSTAVEQEDPHVGDVDSSRA